MNPGQLRVTSQISVGAFVHTRAIGNERALNLAAAKFVHRRSSILRRTRHNTLSGLAEAYPDLFGTTEIDANHIPAVSLPDRLRHILLDSSRAFQVPELVLHLFAIRRTHEIDSRAFIQMIVSSNEAVNAISRVISEEFRAEIERESAALRRIRSMNSSHVERNQAQEGNSRDNSGRRNDTRFWVRD